jgi:hypothetical protein
MLKRKALKTPSHRRARKAAEPELSHEEVVILDAEAAAQKKSERSWLSMTAVPAEEDRWSHVEEHLLARDHDKGERSWKYFSK